MTETELENALPQRIDGAIAFLAETRPGAYRLAATAVAVVGYAWLLMFPWLVLAGVSGAYEAVTAGPAVTWSHLLAWTVVAAGAALVTYRLLRFRPALPKGVVLDRKEAPALFVLMNELRMQYRGPWIDRVMISGEFALDIVKTPYSGLPLWSTNTLIIGLPVIQSLSPVQFRCALARRLGQCSKRHNRIGNWLYQLRVIWPLYTVTTEPENPGWQPVRWFFRFYAPLYARVSLPAARLDELAADSYAMQACTDEEVRDMITTETVCRRYLEEKYWPTYRKLTARVRDALPKPHAGMAAVLRAGLQGDRSEEWLVKAVNEIPRPDDPVPSLLQRVENIGHRTPRMSGIAPESAATVYLGATIEEFDAALGLEPHAAASPEHTRNPVVFVLRSIISSLTRRFRHGPMDPDATVAHRSGQITPLQ